MASIKLKGDTSGEVTIQTPAVAGTTTYNLSTAGGDILASGDIGVSVQGYDADTAKYDDATANFTGTLQQGGNNVLDTTSTLSSSNLSGALPAIDGSALTNLPASGKILQVVSNTFNDRLSYGTADGSGAATGVTNGFTIIPTYTHTDIVAQGTNSKFLMLFDGNIGTTADGTNGTGDWIGGIGLVVDPAGGTSWTQIGSGVNTVNADNIKFFQSRGGSTASGNDPFHHHQMSHNVLYTSSVSAGTTLRFGAEYFHYDTSIHDNLVINRLPNDQMGNQVYSGGSATTITIMEIAG